MNRSRERAIDEIPTSKINMYKFLEYTRPPPTPSTRFRMRDNFMNRVQSPMSRGDTNTIDYLNNQSVYSVEGSPAKEGQPMYDAIPPKPPTPGPPNMMPLNSNFLTSSFVISLSESTSFMYFIFEN